MSDKKSNKSIATEQSSKMMEVRSHENDPYVLKKLKMAKDILDKYGLPPNHRFSHK